MPHARVRYLCRYGGQVPRYRVQVVCMCNARSVRIPLSRNESLFRRDAFRACIGVCCFFMKVTRGRTADARVHEYMACVGNQWQLPWRDTYFPIRSSDRGFWLSLPCNQGFRCHCLIAQIHSSKYRCLGTNRQSPQSGVSSEAYIDFQHFSSK